MTPEGERLGSTVRIDNDPFELARLVASWGERPEVVLDATYGWYWAADVLADAGATVHLAHPLGVKGFAYRRVKNDELDARDLADLLRMGRLPEAWVAPPDVRGLREAVRHRCMLCWPSRACTCRCQTCSVSAGRRCLTSWPWTPRSTPACSRFAGSSTRSPSRSTFGPSAPAASSPAPPVSRRAGRRCARPKCRSRRCTRR